jgi:NAD(P)-dependent dehydrogenase (short-subunit alcohol dehydrogenase family)
MEPSRTTPNRYEGRVAVVTGAASGIGAAIARRLVAEGGRVAGGDVNEDGLAAMAAELGPAFVGVRCDVTVEADVEALVATAAEGHGGLHVGFNVAGASRPAAIVDMTEEDWDFTVDLCLKGVFLSIKHEARRLVAAGTGGAIVNISSLNSQVPMFFGAAYSSAKAGVVMLGRNAALELAEHGIRVTTISPGLTATPLVDPMTSLPAALDAFMDRIPLKRPATPDDIAATALHLASDDAAYITGVNVFVDGGWELTGYPDLRPLIERIMANLEATAGDA